MINDKNAKPSFPMFLLGRFHLSASALAFGGGTPSSTKDVDPMTWCCSPCASRLAGDRPGGERSSDPEPRRRSSKASEADGLYAPYGEEVVVRV